MTYICTVAYMYWRKIPDPFLGPKDVYYCYYSEVSQGSPPFPECISSCNTSLYLKFLAPNLTVFSVATSLRETLSSKEIFAGPCSFCGVILTSFRWPAEESIGGCYIALVGVLGATGTCKSSTCLCTSRLSLCSQTRSAAQLGSENMYFTSVILRSQSTLVFTSGMIIFKIPVVITTGGMFLDPFGKQPPVVASLCIH